MNNFLFTGVVNIKKLHVVGSWLILAYLYYKSDENIIFKHIFTRYNNRCSYIYFLNPVLVFFGFSGINEKNNSHGKLI